MSNELMNELRGAMSDECGMYDVVALGTCDKAASRIDQLTAERDEYKAECERLREAINAALDHIKTLPEDSMGLDPHLGYPYRDEMISRFEGALNKENTDD